MYCVHVYSLVPRLKKGKYTCTSLLPLFEPGYEASTYTLIMIIYYNYYNYYMYLELL